MVKCSKAEVRRLRTALRWKIPAAQRQRIQMVLLRESGMAQPAIAAAMGVSLTRQAAPVHAYVPQLGAGSGLVQYSSGEFRGSRSADRDLGADRIQRAKHRAHPI